MSEGATSSQTAAVKNKKVSSNNVSINSGTASGNINIPQLASFDPSSLIGKVTYELNSDNIITWQMFIRGIFQYYGVEDWLDRNHTSKVAIDPMDIEQEDKRIKVPF